MTSRWIVTVLIAVVHLIITFGCVCGCVNACLCNFIDELSKVLLKANSSRKLNEWKHAGSQQVLWIQNGWDVGCKRAHSFQMVFERLRSSCTTDSKITGRTQANNSSVQQWWAEGYLWMHSSLSLEGDGLQQQHKITLGCRSFQLIIYQANVVMRKQKPHHLNVTATKCCCCWPCHRAPVRNITARAAAKTSPALNVWWYQVSNPNSKRTYPPV